MFLHHKPYLPAARWFSCGRQCSLDQFSLTFFGLETLVYFSCYQKKVRENTSSKKSINFDSQRNYSLAEISEFSPSIHSNFEREIVILRNCNGPAVHTSYKGVNFFFHSFIFMRPRALRFYTVATSGILFRQISSKVPSNFHYKVHSTICNFTKVQVPCNQARTQGGCRGCIPSPDLKRCWHYTWFHWKSSPKIFLYCTLLNR